MQPRRQVRSLAIVAWLRSQALAWRWQRCAALRYGWQAAATMPAPVQAIGWPSLALPATRSPPPSMPHPSLPSCGSGDWMERCRRLLAKRNSAAKLDGCLAAVQSSVDAAVTQFERRLDVSRLRGRAENLAAGRPSAAGSHRGLPTAAGGTSSATGPACTLLNAVLPRSPMNGRLASFISLLLFPLLRPADGEALDRTGPQPSGAAAAAPRRSWRAALPLPAPSGRRCDG